MHSIAVDIVVPVYNEKAILRSSITTLHSYLTANLPFSWRIVIADNASTDGTSAVAEALSRELASVCCLRLPEKGRGRALRLAWMTSEAEVVAYTDVDLSTGLTGLLPLVAPLISGHSDISVGSRLSPNSSVARGPKRELVSRAYNLLLRVIFAVRFRDAQCGFKAVRSDVARRLLPAVRDEEWFFDTELLLLAEHNGLRVHEVPVDWVDDPDSRVQVSSTALADLRDVCRVLWTFMRGGGSVDLGSSERQPLVDDFGRQTVAFAIVGVASGFVSLILFLLLREPIGAVEASILAYSATTAINVWAHRRWTFRRRGRENRWRQLIISVLAFAVTVAVAAVGVAAVDGNSVAEIAVLLVTWAVAGLVRFLILRSWVYRAPRVTS